MFSAYTQNLNHYTVAALMIVESSCFIPFPSEVVVPPAAYQACNPDNKKLYVTDSKWINVSLVVLFATIGAMIGAVINYFFALYVGRPVIYWFVETKLGRLCLLDSKKIQRAEAYFVKNGSISTFIGRLIPGIRQVISVPAGLAKMKLKPFILYTALGAGIWNIALAILGYFAHGQQDIIQRYSSEISYIILGLAVLFGCYLLWKAFGKKKTVVSDNH
ncbi:MAG: DedA family protein [Lentimicrobiaceae bacterium]|nr:DedA family protein [Lentimicrobiaceae bacterium]